MERLAFGSHDNAICNLDKDQPQIKQFSFPELQTSSLVIVINFKMPLIVVILKIVMVNVIFIKLMAVTSFMLIQVKIVKKFITS